LIKTVLKYGLIVLFALAFIKAKGQQYTEYDLKAAYVYNFSKFVNWPSSAFETESSPFIITVFGDNPITPVLHKALKSKNIKGREIKIRVIYAVEEIGETHILFVSRNNQGQLDNIIDICENRPILVVGDVIENFCQSGGIINFTAKSSKYRFEINNQSAQSSNLRISSKLLALSRIISSEEIKF
jgi:hypothetical protein